MLGTYNTYNTLGFR